MKIKPRAFLRSDIWSPGLMNLQNSNNMYGKARMNPAVSEVQR